MSYLWIHREFFRETFKHLHQQEETRRVPHQRLDPDDYHPQDDAPQSPSGRTSDVGFVTKGGVGWVGVGGCLSDPQTELYVSTKPPEVSPDARLSGPRVVWD